MKLSIHFNSSEFACYDKCGFDSVDPKLISLLEFIRSKVGDRVITITPRGGCRCPNQNTKSGGKPHSQHLLGKAADITIAGMSAHEVHTLISKLHTDGLAHVGGLGKYATFTHVDVREGVARWG